MSIATISNDFLTVQVATKGAELQSIKDKNGSERLWQGDPAVWSGRAPVLFPNPGGLREDCYYLDGVKYDMPKHGFVRKIEWQLEKQEKDTMTFLMTDKHAGFPFNYELRAIYTLEGDKLLVDYNVKNLDNRDFCFSLGSHEAYSTPEGIEAYQIRLDKAETWYNHELVGNLISAETAVKAENTDVFPLNYADYAVDAVVFDAPKSRAVTLESKLHDRKIRVEFPECTTLMLWTKPGANYICIEPWCKSPDTLDADMDIRRKPGMFTLNPGEEKTVRHTIQVL